MKFWRIFQVVGMLTSWLSQAAADGKITVAELADLVNTVAPTLGLKAQIDVPPPELGQQTMAVRDQH